jgi:hypothetical protein
MLVIVYLWIRPVYHIDTWKGISVEVIQQAVEPKPMMKFFKLSLGGVVSLSEWWFWVSEYSVLAMMIVFLRLFVV